jgi:hypothetical protein
LRRARYGLYGGCPIRSSSLSIIRFKTLLGQCIDALSKCRITFVHATAFHLNNKTASIHQSHYRRSRLYSSSHLRVKCWSETLLYYWRKRSASFCDNETAVRFH